MFYKSLDYALITGTVTMMGAVLVTFTQVLQNIANKTTEPKKLKEKRDKV